MSRTQQTPTGVPLPIFSGRLSGEGFGPWAQRLLAWLKLHEIPEDDAQRRADLLVLAMEADSPAQRHFFSLPAEYRASWQHALAALQARFESTVRLEMAKQAALNAIMSRSFRDDQHRGESVQDLIDQFESLGGKAGLNEQDQRRYFLQCFAKFSAASRMLARTTTLEEACMQALQWEKVLVQKTTAVTSPAL